MKQLFLKSNILHIRTNEGVFEVSNPEVANQFTIDDGNKFIFGLKSVEWPYGVDLIDMLQIRVGNEWKNLLYQKEYKGNMESTRTIKLARLLPPEEEKKDDIQPKRWEESTSIPSKSAYKEFEGKDLNSPYNCPFDNKPCFKSNCVHSDEYPALCGNKDEKMKPVSAPSESQEEMYNEVRQEYLKHRGRIWTKEDVMLKWIIENYKLITRNP